MKLVFLSFREPKQNLHPLHVRFHDGLKTIVEGGSWLGAALECCEKYLKHRAVSSANFLVWSYILQTPEIT
jgi:hypothetical protein